MKMLSRKFINDYAVDSCMFVLLNFPAVLPKPFYSCWESANRQTCCTCRSHDFDIVSRLFTSNVIVWYYMYVTYVSTQL